jgi:antitoxin HigA-1
MTLKSSTTTRAARQVRERSRFIHPGAFLAEGLSGLGISQAEFARSIGVSAMRISHVIKGSRPVTAELALLFGKSFGQTAQYWLNLQRQYDLELAERSLGTRLDAIKPIAPSNALAVLKR